MALLQLRQWPILAQRSISTLTVSRKHATESNLLGQLNGGDLRTRWFEPRRGWHLESATRGHRRQNIKVFLTKTAEAVRAVLNSQTRSIETPYVLTDHAFEFLDTTTRLSNRTEW